MKNYTLLILLFISTLVFAQEKTFDEQVKEISRKIERTTEKEKTYLKEKIKSIQARIDNNEITPEEGEKLKLEAAEEHANNIEDNVSILQKRLQQLVEDKANGKLPEDSKETDDEIEITIGDDNLKIKPPKVTKEKKRKWKKEKSKKTTTQLVFAYGVNNVIKNHQISSLDNSVYKFGKSHFYELGFSLKTPLFAEKSKAYFKYGFSFLWNNLRPVENKVHSVVNGNTVLIDYPTDLSESRLRNTQLIFPAHLEFDFSEDDERDRTHKGLRLGIGGYGGVKLGTRQKLEYRNNLDYKVKETQKGSFNTSTFTYGLSSYIAYKSVGVYAKYDIAPLFKSSETRNVSIGVRFDFY